MSWENIVKKGGRPQINQKGSMVNVDGFETKVKISKWNYKGKERTGDCTVTWGIQIIVRDDYIREMHLSVDKIAFEDGRVYGTEGIFDTFETNITGKPFESLSGKFHPTSVYMDEQDKYPLVTFEAY